MTAAGGARRATDPSGGERPPASDPTSVPVGAVVVSGPAGSGKTTFARALARRAGYALFDLDVVVGPVTEAALGLLGSGADGVDGEAGARLRAARYDSLVAAAADNRALGLGVVLAAPFTSERADPTVWADTARRLAGPGGERVVLVYLDCPPDLLARRVAARGAARDGRKIRGERAAAPSSPPLSPHVRVDGALLVDAQLAAMAGALGLGGGDGSPLAPDGDRPPIRSGPRRGPGGTEVARC